MANKNFDRLQKEMEKFFDQVIDEERDGLDGNFVFYNTSDPIVALDELPIFAKGALFALGRINDARKILDQLKAMYDYKPVLCSWCGSIKEPPEILDFEMNEKEGLVVECSDCGMRGPWADDETTAIKYWNAVMENKDAK